MIAARRSIAGALRYVLASIALLVAAACTTQVSRMHNRAPAALDDFARRYTAAWCSQQAASVAGFFAEDGSLQINEGAASVGRQQIAAAAQGFMTAFPDLVVQMDRLVTRGDRIEYHWTLTGANTGPGGTGRRVRISGFEAWRFGGDGLIAESKGHYDAGEYQRQLREGAGGPR